MDAAAANNKIFFIYPSFKKSFSDGLLSSGRLKQLFRDMVYPCFQCRRFVRCSVFAAADGLSVNKIAFEAEGFPRGQEYEAENIGLRRENPFQKYKIRRTLERGGKGKAASGIVTRKVAVKQVVHFCSISCRLPETSAAFFCRFAGAHQNARRVLPFRFIGW